MKKIFYLNFVILFASCANEESFDSFASLFSDTEMPILIDSSFVENLKTDQSIKVIDEAKLQFVQVDEFTSKHSDRQKYILKPLYKVEIDNYTGLIYYASLNPDIPFDVMIGKVFIGIYNQDGKLTSYKEVAGYESHFGLDKLRLAEISSDFEIEVLVQETKKNISEGTSETTNESESYSLNERGLIL